MNYPITDAYLADRLRRALEEMRVSSVAACDLRELALFFEMRDNFARLTARDQESVAEYARELVRSDERRRVENETAKRLTCPQCQRPKPDNRTLGERLKGSD
jgi:hypothetical protein